MKFLVLISPRRFGLLFACWCGPIGAASAAVLPEAELMKFFLPAEVDSLKRSPDGAHVAAIARSGDAAMLGMFDLKTGKQEIVHRSTTGQVIDFWWLSSQRLLLLTLNWKDVKLEYSAIDRDGTKAEDLWRINEFGRVIGTFPDQPDTILMAAGSVVGRVNLAAKKRDIIESNLHEVFEWFADANGEVRAAYGVTHANYLKVWWRAPGEKAWKVRSVKVEDREILPLGFDRDPRFLFVSDFKQGDCLTISRFDTVTEQREVVVRREGLEPTHVLTLAGPPRVLAARFAQVPDGPMSALDFRYARALGALQRKFPNYLVNVLDAPAPDRSWLVSVSRSQVPEAFLLFNPQTSETELIANSTGQRLPEASLAAAESFSAAARDGRRLSGLLWRPAGVNRPPLVVRVPEGLPTPATFNQYSAVNQALVACGFAVVEINTRGTGGFGRKHLEAAEPAIGESLTQDFEDVIAVLARNQVIDDRRVALLGWGMGGALSTYLTAGSKSFAAAVNVNGPVELGRHDLVGMSTQRDSSQLGRQFGSWQKAKELAEEMSVLSSSIRCTVPALHLYNDAPANDGSLNDHGRRVRRAIEAAKVPGRVEPAYSWTNGVKLETQRAREQAAVVRRIAAFLETALPAR